MRWRPLYLASLIVIAMCGGCMSTTNTSGRPILDTAVSQIVKGKTTTDGIISVFGAPHSRTDMGGTVLFIYRYEQTKQDFGFLPYYTRGTGSATSDELTISVDKATETVKTYSLQRGIKT